MPVIGGHAGITILPVLSQVGRAGVQQAVPQGGQSPGSIRAQLICWNSVSLQTCIGCVCCNECKVLYACFVLQTVPSVTFGDAERESLTKRIQVRALASQA